MPLPDALAEHQHAERHSDERVDEVAKRGVDDVAMRHGPDVDAPVDRDQRRRRQQLEPGAHAEPPQVTESARPDEDEEQTGRAPHDAVGEYLERSGGQQQREEQRKQAPRDEGACAEQHARPSGARFWVATHDSWWRNKSSACCRSAGYGLMISMRRRPSAGWANASDR